MVVRTPGKLTLEEGREHLGAHLKNLAIEPLSEGDNFDIQTYFENATRPIPDVFWELAIAGILRHRSGSDYSLTQEGWRILREDISPYEGDPFVVAVERKASMLDAGAKGYLELAVRCLRAGVPQAAVALLRVAMELDVDSIIDAALGPWSPGTVARKRLTHRNISDRIKALLVQLAPGGKGIQSQEDNDLFRSYVDQIRIAGNKVVHPGSMRPNINVLEVPALFHAYRRFVSMSSGVKEVL